MQAEFAGNARFQVLRRIGRGGMGAVYEAVDLVRDEHLALKALSWRGSDAILRFKREFRALQDLRHPNLVRLGELYEDAGAWFFTMELIDGVDLATYVRGAAKVTDERDTLADDPRAAGFDEMRLRACLAMLADVVATVHAAGLVHRDIKPSNVLVTPAGRLVLLDFGLVIGAEPGELRVTAEDAMVGTAAYMAPEQAGGLPVGPPADWYAVGVLLHEILTGRLPFTGNAQEILWRKQQLEPPPPSAFADVPADLDGLCAALLRVEPDRRPDGREVLARLGAPLAAAAAAAPPGDTGDRMPFVGRDRELAALRAAFDAARADRSTVVELRGESGAGKTALLARFGALLADERAGALVLSGRCHEREAVPYKALDGVVESLAAWAARQGDVSAATLVPRAAWLLVRAFPTLERVPGFAAAAPPRGAAADAVERRRLVGTSLRELMARLAERRTPVLLIDDVQWADRDGLALLEALVRPPGAPGLLLVVAMRPGTRAPLPGAQVIDIDPLSDADAHALAEELAGRVDRGAALDVDALVADAGGSPALLVDLIDHAARGTGDRLRFHEAIDRRVDQLSAGARRVLHLLSIATSPPRRPALAAAAGTGPAALEGWLTELRDARLARTAGAQPDDPAEVHHERLRAIVLGLMSAEEQRAAHAALAGTLVGDDRVDPATLAEHWVSAGEPERAARHALDAARRSVQQLAFDRAAALFRRALSLGGAGDAPCAVRCELAEALVALGRCGEAAEFYLEAAASASGLLALDLRRRAAEQLLHHGDIGRGRELMAQVLAEVGIAMPSSPRRAALSVAIARARRRGRLDLHGGAASPLDALRIDVCWTAVTCLSSLDPAIGAAMQAHNLRLSLEAGEPARAARAIAIESFLSATEGRSAARRTAGLLGRARELADGSDDPYLRAWAAAAVGLSAYSEARWRAGIEHCVEAEALLRECQGVNWERGMLMTHIAWAQAMCGRLVEARARMATAQAHARERGDIMATFLPVTGPAVLVQIARGELDEAYGCALESYTFERRYDLPVIHRCGGYSMTEVDIARDRGDDAWARMTGAWPSMRRSQILRGFVPRVLLLWQRGRAALAASAGGAPARRDAERMASRLTAERTTWTDALAALLRAGLAARRGDADVAIRLLADAASALDVEDMPVHAAIARHRRGALLGGDQGARVAADAAAALATAGVTHLEPVLRLVTPGL